MLRGALTMRLVLALLAASVVGLGSPVLARAYNWPLKPFDRPHPIRGGFGDPRWHIDGAGELAAFHFGIDIAAPDGTPVYAVAPGRVFRHQDAVTVSVDGRAFGYWHIDPLVTSGEEVHVHQLLGRVRAGQGHLHFAEAYLGRYLNPLRRGALAPFRDRTRPVVASVRIVSKPDVSAPGFALPGMVGIVADIYDLPPLLPPVPWRTARLTPARVRWRLRRGPEVVLPWRTAVDFRVRLLPNFLFDSVYAPGTFQNKPGREGTYLFWLDDYLDTAALAQGTYTVDVRASDTRGNVGRGWATFSVGAAS
jgi:Peptidase family M23